MYSEGSGRDLVSGKISAFSFAGRKSHRNLPRETLLVTRYETRTFRIQSRSGIHSTATCGSQLWSHLTFCLLNTCLFVSNPSKRHGLPCRSIICYKMESKGLVILSAECTTILVYWLSCDYHNTQPLFVGLGDVEDPILSRQSAQRLRWGCELNTPAALYSQDTFFSFAYSFLLEIE
jgi:hypothetical protein